MASRDNDQVGRTEEQTEGLSFTVIARDTSAALGSSWAFALACGVVLVWAITGPLFRYSDSWQLVINTGTTIVTFLMVFLIQNTQTRDARAIHLKLDELIRSTNAARNRLIDLEECSDEELDRIKREFDRLKAHAGLDRGDKGSGKVGEPEQRRDSVDG
jgi:low affinity Fe/Cu permease